MIFILISQTRRLRLKKSCWSSHSWEEQGFKSCSPLKALSSALANLISWLGSQSSLKMHVPFLCTLVFPFYFLNHGGILAIQIGQWLSSPGPSSGPPNYECDLSASSRAAKAKYNRLGSFNNRHLYLLLLEAGNSNIKLLV